MMQSSGSGSGSNSPVPSLKFSPPSHSEEDEDQEHTPRTREAMKNHKKFNWLNGQLMLLVSSVPLSEARLIKALQKEIEEQVEKIEKPFKAEEKICRDEEAKKRLHKNKKNKIFESVCLFLHERVRTAKERKYEKSVYTQYGKQTINENLPPDNYIDVLNGKAAHPDTKFNLSMRLAYLLKELEFNVNSEESLPYDKLKDDYIFNFNWPFKRDEKKEITNSKKKTTWLGERLNIIKKTLCLQKKLSDKDAAAIMYLIESAGASMRMIKSAPGGFNVNASIQLTFDTVTGSSSAGINKELKEKNVNKMYEFVFMQIVAKIRETILEKYKKYKKSKSLSPRRDKSLYGYLEYVKANPNELLLDSMLACTLNEVFMMDPWLNMDFLPVQDFNFQYEGFIPFISGELSATYDSRYQIVK